MKSRLATSIRSSFLYMNLRGRIPVSTLLAVIVTAAAWAQSAPAGNDWAALVLEKLEGEIKDNSGKTSKIYVMGVVRDGWGKLNDNQWTLLWSEQLGQQLWEEQIPPIANW